MKGLSSRFLRLFSESKRFAQTLRVGKFDKLFRKMPERIQRNADAVYVAWRKDPSSVDFRPLTGSPDYWRISLADGYRAMGKAEGDTIRWFWIGTHNDYEKLTRQL